MGSFDLWLWFHPFGINRRGEEFVIGNLLLVRGLFLGGVVGRD